MKTEERDSMVQYLIQIKEKVKSEENSMLPALKEIELKIKGLEEERKTEKNRILDFIDEFKTIIINTPIEKEKEKKEGWYKKWKL